MLSFLLLASTSGQPLSADAVARCSRLPSHDLTFVPTASTTWRSDDGHVVLAAWGDDAQQWHVGEHGCTLTTGTPWPLTDGFSAPSGIAFELTSKLGEGPADDGVPGWLTGATAIVRVRADGSGFAAAPATGGGTVHVASGDGVLAVSDRAGVAAAGGGGAPRRSDLPALVGGVLTGSTAAFVGVERVRPGGHVALSGRAGAKLVDGPVPWGDHPTATVAELLPAAADDIARLVELAAATSRDRWLEVGADAGSLVLAAAVAATGTIGRFRVRALSSGTSETAAQRLAAELGAGLESVRTLQAGGEALDRRVREAVASVQGLAAPTAVTGGLLGTPRQQDGVVLASVPGGALAPDRGASGRRLLTSQAWATVDAAQRAWEAGRARAVRGDAARAVLAELDLRAPGRQSAAADLAGPATLLDPLSVPSVARLALAAASEGVDATALLVEALHPPMLRLRTAGGDEPTGVGEAGWRTLAPVVEAHVLGHARDAVREVIDLSEVALAVRSGTTPDVDTIRALEGALALAVWAAGTDIHAPTPPRPVEVRRDVETPSQTPTLVTGVTSRSLLLLADLSIPLDAIEVDALLGIEIDREVRDLVHRVLLAVGATPGQLPGDLDERLSGPATAHLAGPARTLLARRGGTLSDARLALTLPFWRAHVATPQVVLVAERPPDLAARSRAQLPSRDLLGWWVDAMTSAGAYGADVRIVDPADLMDLGEIEASAWAGLGEDGDDAPDLVRVVRTVDSLVREVELEAARPLLRMVRLARANETAEHRPRPLPATAPLHVVDQLWARAVDVDRRLTEQQSVVAERDARVLELESQVTELQARRGLKAAWRLLTGGPDEN